METYNTADELDFISKLGSYKAGTPSRLVLLHRYIKAWPRRVEWGRIDKDAAIVHARAELAKEAEKRRERGERWRT
jgi:hypothetical protein